MATTIRTSQSEGMSTGAYENYLRLQQQLLQDEEDDDYVQRCCFCESMSYARFFGIYSTLLSLLLLWFRLKAAVTDALVLDFGDLMLELMKFALCIPILCFFSMVLVAFSFKYRKGNLLYGPMILHNKLDDLAIDHPGRTYEELHAYLMHVMRQETVVTGLVIAIQMPFHLAFIMVCWRLRGHLEQQKAAMKARETKAMKIKEEKMKKTD